GGFHLGAEDRIDAGEAREGEDGFLDGDVGGNALGGEAEFAELAAGHHESGELGEGHADGLADEGDGAGGARVDFEDIDFAVEDGELDVDKADDAEFAREHPGLLHQHVLQLAREASRGKRACAVTGMDSGMLDVFHDSADHDGLAVADRIDVHLCRSAQVAVDKERVAFGGLKGLRDVAAQRGFVRDYLHRAAAEDVGRADEDGVADSRGPGDGFIESAGEDALRLLEAELVDQRVEALAILGPIDRIGRGAENRNAGAFEGDGEFERGLPAELHNDAAGFFAFGDRDDVLEGERLEIEAVRDVVIGRDGFRIAIDHDRLEAGVLEGEACVNAAIVELDALSDAVWAAA